VQAPNGSIDETIPLEEQAIRLSPRDPYVYSRYLVIAEVYLLQSRIEEAIVWLERARTANPALPSVHAYLASAYALKGDLARAVAELAEARRLTSGNDYSSILYLRAGFWGYRRFEPSTKQPFSQASAWPECRKNEPDPPSRRLSRYCNLCRVRGLRAWRVVSLEHPAVYAEGFREARAAGRLRRSPALPRRDDRRAGPTTPDPE
jgi:tetratricopeptide (TPR) repeat protein